MIGANYQNFEAEQSVLGAVLLDNDCLDQIIFLEARDFQNDTHKKIYETMRWLESKNYPIDIVSIVDVFEKKKMIEQIGGVSYIASLVDSCPSTANIEYYARLVRSHAMERRVHETGHLLLDMHRGDYETDEELFYYIESLFETLRPEENTKMKSLPDAKEPYFEHLKTPVKSIKTKFERFDKWSGGVGRGWLYVSAGRPSVGKTAMMIQRNLGIAKQGEGAAIIFSQEMDRNQVLDRAVSNVTGIQYNSIRRKELTEKQWNLINAAYADIEKLPLFIQDTPSVTIDEVKATAKQIKKKHGKIASITVDYLQIMNIPRAKGESEATAIGKVTTKAKQIARELDCCFIMLSQLSRGFENNNGIERAPQFKDLKGSGSIEQDADVIEFLWHKQDDVVTGGKVIQQTIAKGRDIGLNNFRLLFSGWKQHFQELPDKEWQK